MNNKKIENIVGALSIAITDDILREAQSYLTVSAPAAVLTLLGHAPGITIDQLRRALSMSHPGTVRLVNRLVEEGLVQRDKSPSDGRAVALTLSPNGEARSQQILNSRQTVLSQALTVLSQTERDVLGKITEKLLRATLKDGLHAVVVCRLCDQAVCSDCPVEAEVIERTEGLSDAAPSQ